MQHPPSPPTTYTALLLGGRMEKPDRYDYLRRYLLAHLNLGSLPLGAALPSPFRTVVLLGNERISWQLDPGICGGSGMNGMARCLGIGVQKSKQKTVSDTLKSLEKAGLLIRVNSAKKYLRRIYEIVLVSEEEARRRLSSSSTPSPPNSPQLPSPHQDQPRQDYSADLFDESWDLISPPPSPSCYSSSSSEDEVLRESMADFVEEMLDLEPPSPAIIKTTATTISANTTSPTTTSPATPAPQVDVPTPMDEDILWAAEQDLVVLICSECRFRPAGVCHTRPPNSFDKKGDPESAHMFFMQQQYRRKYLGHN